MKKVKKSKQDLESKHTCPFCGSKNLLDIDDNYTRCLKCKCSFVGA